MTSDETRPDLQPEPRCPKQTCSMCFPRLPCRADCTFCHPLPDETRPDRDALRDRLAAAFMNEGTFRDLQANDDWGYAAADLALSVWGDTCTCVPHPYGGGVEEDCEVHGEDRAALIRQREGAALICKCGARHDGSVGHDPAVHAAYGEPLPETRHDRDTLRAIRAAIADPSRYVDRRQDINTQESLAEWQARAVLAVLEPALAQRDADKARLIRELDEAQRIQEHYVQQRDEARRVIAAVEALCDRWAMEHNTVYIDDLRAALASGDQP